ncbi:HlyC/CorC family transporter [Sphingomonas sp. ABOLG]|uniref:HlyC/CorC family transporter n=1 Tax=Sphingomonas olei TaxID=1886787 RepID=A0ABY2QKN4_9SPHN|nr:MULTISPECIES: hemolysin family protein [Sphingomonas]KKI19038.1 cobalt transporter [Sphingomonas sp. Ag1]MDF2604471.1 cobalt transporter [Sphingomonas sp.]RSV20519.1 HlyC/CorC family transporter [Sphingomonas sp. ABOLG]THG41533.1 HlyC/CorC family transporter [Sphingomonas olei]
MSEDRSSAGNGEPGEGSIWRGLRTLIFGDSEEATLREVLEAAIDRHEEEDRPETKGDLTPLERQMVRNLLHFSERDAGDVGVPRADIIAIEERTPFDELVHVFADAGVSRVPVYRERLDTIIGMVHVKDVFAILAGDGPRPDDITGLIRQPLYVPMSRGALDLLADMRQTRVHLAVVLDEYSGTEGLVTIEDLIEEIVGEIEDEHDEAPAALLVPTDGGAWDADARAELEDIAELVDARFDKAGYDVDTIGGLTAALAGHVPEPGDCIDHPSGWRIEVLDADERRVNRVRLHPPQPEPEED